jgi:hypothetical protein
LKRGAGTKAGELAVAPSGLGEAEEEREEAMDRKNVTILT